MDSVLYFETKAFLGALMYTQPRTLAMLAVLPIFNSQIVPGMLRLAVGAGVGAVAAPMLMPAIGYANDVSAAQLILLLVKEAGGTVTDLSGGNGAIWSGDVLAANESIHGQMMKALKAVK